MVQQLSFAETPPQKPKAKAKPERGRLTAEKLGELQREISISEFFTKNRHLLGFDNASRALLTSVKEAVDNSLDACEEAGILPDIRIVIEPVGESRFRMLVEDNGPGIIKAQVPKVFAKLLYGSKFHRLRQSRGQQGIGISAAGMYGQLTTGKPVHVISKTGKGRPAYACDLVIDAQKNKPVVFHETEDTSPHWLEKSHGTSVLIEMEATYKGGKRSLDEWLQQVAFANPHARLTYLPPAKAPVVYPRVTLDLPPETREIKPHPHGVELGVLLRMQQTSASRTLASFLQSDFSRVSPALAQELCRTARLSPDHALKRVALSRMLEDDISESLTYMNYPIEHWSRIRTINVIERLNSEIKRRTDVVRIFPNAPSALRLIASVCIEQNEEWITGKKYLNMEYLKNLNKMKRNRESENTLVAIT